MCSATILMFPGAEWIPEASEANCAFREFIRQNCAPHCRLVWVTPTLSAARELAQILVSDRASCVAIGYSWGAVVASLVARLSPSIVALIVIDGWNVPVTGLPMPVYRLSRDWSTHLNGLCFGRGVEQFYADPAIEHLAWWQHLDSVRGWHCTSAGYASTTAAVFLRSCLARYDARLS